MRIKLYNDEELEVLCRKEFIDDNEFNVFLQSLEPNGYYEATIIDISSYYSYLKHYIDPITLEYLLEILLNREVIFDVAKGLPVINNEEYFQIKELMDKADINFRIKLFKLNSIIKHLANYLIDYKDLSYAGVIKNNWSTVRLIKLKDF